MHVWVILEILSMVLLALSINHTAKYRSTAKAAMPFSLRRPPEGARRRFAPQIALLAPSSDGAAAFSILAVPPTPPKRRRPAHTAPPFPPRLPTASAPRRLRRRGSGGFLPPLPRSPSPLQFSSDFHKTSLDIFGEYCYNSCTANSCSKDIKERRTAWMNQSISGSRLNR